jgi:malonate decarboxylase alpha subunit
MFATRGQPFYEMGIMPKKDSGMTDWQKQRSERSARLNAGSHHASGKMAPPDKAKPFLEAVVRPGDRICLEGDNQKQADFLAEVLADVDRSRIHDLHIVQSGIVLQAHLDLFGRGIARKLDFSYSGAQGAALARALLAGKIELRFGDCRDAPEIWGKAGLHRTRRN